MGRDGLNTITLATNHVFQTFPDIFIMLSHIHMVLYYDTMWRNKTNFTGLFMASRKQKQDTMKGNFLADQTSVLRVSVNHDDSFC